MFYDVYVNQLNTGYVTHLGALMRSHRGINVYDLCYVQCMHRLSLGYKWKEKFLIFMYVVDHVWD